MPQVIAIDTTRIVVPYHYLILSHLPGQPLIDLWPTMSEKDRQQCAHQAGVYLAQLHDVTIDYYGELMTPSSTFKDFYEYAIDFCARYVLPAAETRLYTRRMNEQLSVLLDACRPFIQYLQPHLTHSDFLFGNILTDGKTITGVLDFEDALGGDPTWDFLVEDQWDEQCPGSRKYLYEGYESVRLLDVHHALKVRLYKAMNCLQTIALVPELRQEAVERFNRLFSPGGSGV